MRWIIALITTSFPLLANAADIDFGSIFSASSSDASVQLLSMVFGTVTGVLSSSGSQLLGAMFLFYNVCILGFGSLLLSYLVFNSIASSAISGEVLGRKWSSLFVPIRCAFGIVLLTPTLSGYSLMQALMMWFILQGVYAGNSVWGYALSYLDAGGYASTEAPNTDEVIKAVAPAVQIFQLQVCMEKMQQQISSVSGYDYINFYPLWESSRVYFPGGGDYNAYCGSINWSTADELANARQAGVQMMWMQIYPYAASYVDNNGNNPSNISEPDPALQAGIMAAAKSYIGTIAAGTAVNSGEDSAGSSSSKRKFIDAARDDGWALAGAFFFKLLALRADKAKLANTDLPTINKDWSNNIGSLTMLTTSQQNAITTLADKVDSSSGTDLTTVVTDKLKDTDSTDDSNLESLGFDTSTSGKSGGKLFVLKFGDSIKFDMMDTILRIFMSDLWYVKQRIFKMKEPDYQANPIIDLAEIGAYLLEGAIKGWGLSILLALMAGLVSVITGATGFGYGVISAMFYVVGATTFLIAIQVTIGFAFAFIVPFTPFVSFFFGVIGWLGGAVEAMVAAPIIGLSLAHPDGHEILGYKTKPAIMLTANIFMRPSLMIFGLVCSMLLSFVGMYLLSLGFATAEATLNAGVSMGKMDSLLGIFSWLCFLILFGGIVASLITNSFVLIHDIPDKIMRWLGDRSSIGSGKGAEQAVNQQARGAGGTLAQQGQQQAQGMHGVIGGYRAAESRYKQIGTNANNTDPGG